MHLNVHADEDGGVAQGNGLVSTATGMLNGDYPCRFVDCQKHMEHMVECYCLCIVKS